MSDLLRKRFLVTGVAGFIGSNLARHLLAAGARVRGIDNFATGRRSNLAGLDDLELIEGDVTDPAAIDAATAGVDFVLHHAALGSVPRSVEDPVASNHANVTGTLCVLEAARAQNVERVVFAASSSAYGDLPELPKREEMAPRPLSPYAVSKLTGELYCTVYTRCYGLECVALRYFNVFGPHQDPDAPYAAVIPKFVQCLLCGEAPPIYGDGKQTRDFTFIGNVIDANLKACTAPKAAGEVFNIGCGVRVSLLELLAAIQNALGTAIEPSFLPPRSGDVRDSLASIDKARELLGYEPAIDLAEGLRRSIDWYRENL